MIAVDTNVLVRLDVDDDPGQTRRARKLFERGDVLVTSTVLLHMRGPDRYRGRVFGLDFSLMTFMSALSSYLTAVGLDHFHHSPRFMAFALGAVFFVPAVPWFIAQRRRDAS